MKKTCELTGIALDWAVAKCEGEDSVAACYYASDDTPLCLDEAPQPLWEPSTNWAQGGPIIERERIRILPWDRPVGVRMHGEWCAGIYDKSVVNGPTPLVAAMRCYVMTKLGKEIDIPKELEI